MNILISSTSFLFSDTEGVGEGIAAYEVIKRLIKRGHKVTVFAPRSNIKDKNIREITSSFNIDLFPAISELREEVGWSYFAHKSFEKAREIVEREKIDIIHHLGPCFAGMYSLMPLISRPFVYGPIPLEHKEIDFEKEFVKNYRQLTSREKEIVRTLNRLSKKQYSKTLHSAAKIVVQLPIVSKSLPRQVRDKCEAIPLGVDTGRFFPKKDSKSNKDVILSVGHMTAIKGFDYLVRAMPYVVKKRPRVRLLLIGEGPDKRYFESLVIKLGLERNIEFLGAISHGDIASYFQRCILYCQPSLSETFGLARLEAMACGKPVVYTSAGSGESGFTSNGKYGGIVSPRRPRGLAREILRFLESPKLIKKSGKINRQLVVKGYDWESIVSKYENIYENLWEK